MCDMQDNIERLCQEYLEAFQAENGDARRRAIIARTRKLVAAQTKQVLPVLIRMLSSDSDKWFVARVAVKAIGSVPKRMLGPMIRAAVYERDPSSNRSFVEPCLATYGHRLVNTMLLDIVESGNDFEKAGAVNALYWAQMPLVFAGGTNSFRVADATAESREAFLVLSDVWARKKALFLREFVRNTNVDVRRSIIPSLDLNKDAYPDDLRRLVSRAIAIARSHSDEYIRHRVEVQLGSKKLLYPLPHRSPAAVTKKRPWWRFWGKS